MAASTDEALQKQVEQLEDSQKKQNQLNDTQLALVTRINELTRTKIRLSAAMEELGTTGDDAPVYLQVEKAFIRRPKNELLASCTNQISSTTADIDRLKPLVVSTEQKIAQAAKTMEELEKTLVQNLKQRQQV